MKIAVWSLMLFALANRAYAEDRIIMYDGAQMKLVVTATGTERLLEIRYIDPPVILREAGVKPDTVLVSGRWDDDEVLAGDAYLFPVWCGKPVSYPVRGVVDVSTTLVIIGPVPNVTAACEVSKYEWTDASVMRFTPPPRAIQKQEKKPKVVAKPKIAKPKPRPRTPVQQQPSYQYPWRWF